MGGHLMIAGYDQFVAQLDEALAAFPSLTIAETDGSKILKGSLAVIDKEGKYWEDYGIEIHCSNDFPNEFPLLFETSGKIPKIADWHIYENTLSCCVKVHPEEIIRCKSGITVIQYITEEVLPYLFNQTHRRVEGYYANCEYAHGAAGIYEYYANILDTGTDIKATLRLLEFIATNERPLRTSMCFCGKKTKFRHCHREAFDKIKLIGYTALTSHIYDIAKSAKLI